MRVGVVVWLGFLDWLWGDGIGDFVLLSNVSFLLQEQPYRRCALVSKSCSRRALVSENP